MRTVDHDGAALAAATWSRVEDGFYVGSRGSAFLGYVDRLPDGRFLACDADSTVIGFFADLDSATAALSGGGSGARGAGAHDE